MQKILVIPDLQVPYHSVSFVKKLLRVTRAWKPDHIHQVGDLLDLPEVSRWTKNLHGEFQATLQGSLDTAHDILKQFRLAAPAASMTVTMGNHDERLEEYIGKFAPALRSLRSSDLGYQLRAGELEVEVKSEPFLLAPGVLAIHGHERAYSSVSGKYELDRIKQYGCSVVSGHTHTPVLVTSAQGFGFQQKHFFGMNVGHAMDLQQVGYVDDGHVNWCQAFGTLEVHGNEVFPRLITAPDGNFSWQGKLY
jgi:metallophosphoesterase superfamily enzyme